MITCTRWPWGRRAFAMGDASSTRRPSGPSMRSMSALSCASSENRASERNRRPSRSKNTSCGPFTMISVTASSAEKPFERAESQHRVHQLVCKPLPLLARHRRPCNVFEHLAARAFQLAARTIRIRRHHDGDVVWPTRASEPAPSTLRGRTKALGALPKPPLRPPRAPGPSKTWLPLHATTRPPRPFRPAWPPKAQSSPATPRRIVGRFEPSRIRQHLAQKPLDARA